MRPLSLAAAVLLLPSAAQAQDLRMLESLFKSLNSFTLAVHTGTLQNGGHLKSECGPMGLCGMGTEVFINLSDTEKATVELALGTSYMRGFTAREETLDLKGAVRSFPTIGVYATRNTIFGQERLQPYVGLSFGNADLWNIQAYDPLGREYSLKGQTYDFGALGGVLATFSGVGGLFLEGGYKNRQFSSVDWGFPSSMDRVPEGWPRELDLSGWMVSVGYQFSLEKEEKPR